MSFRFTSSWPLNLKHDFTQGERYRIRGTVSNNAGEKIYVVEVPARGTNARLAMVRSDGSICNKMANPSYPPNFVMSEYVASDGGKLEFGEPVETVAGANLAAEIRKFTGPKTSLDEDPILKVQRVEECARQVPAARIAMQARQSGVPREELERNNKGDPVAGMMLGTIYMLPVFTDSTDKESAIRNAGFVWRKWCEAIILVDQRKDPKRWRATYHREHSE